MLCAISGEQPKEPVASRKTGTVFEKRLIEIYLAEHGTDPVTGEDLSVDDLIDLKSSRIVHPRPPTQTSIPALLGTFQNEWDAIAIETFELKKQLAQTRQELSTSLYDYEGALRILARVTKERDDARAALAKVQVGGGADTGGAMEVDGDELSDELIQQVDETFSRLSSGRRKRPVPEGWSTIDDIQEFEPVESTGFKPSQPLSRCSALAQSPETEENASRILYGSDSGVALVYEVDGSAPLSEVNVGSRILDGLFWETKTVLALASGAVKIYDGTNEVASFQVHAGPATGVSLHPSGAILASVGADKSYVLYDLTNLSGRPAVRVFSESEFTCCQFHPDGGLLAGGGKDGQVRVFDIKTGSIGAAFESDGSVQSISFSENGYWLASASAGSTSVTVWDLRKTGAQSRAKDLEFGSSVSSVAWDYTGQFLAIAGGNAVGVQTYRKSSKKWAEVLKKAVDAKKVVWDPQGQHILVDGAEGVLELRKAA